MNFFFFLFPPPSPCLPPPPPPPYPRPHPPPPPPPPLPLCLPTSISLSLYSTLFLSINLPAQVFQVPGNRGLELLKDQASTTEGLWRAPEHWVRESRGETQFGLQKVVLVCLSRAHKLRQAIFGHVIFANPFSPCLVSLAFNQELSCEVVWTVINSTQELN
jgi:DNA-binding transcriptional LysR family regulator